jgi:UDP:flavonoid glycosyltransferase YjiC (YdhE family)
MKIGIQTWGSEGDVRPALALAHGLAGSGHSVEFVYTSVEGRDWSPVASSLGLVAEDLGRDELTRQRSMHTGQLEGVLGLRSPLQQVRVITELFLEPVVDAMFERAVRLCETNDLVVAHFLCHPLIAAARMTRRPLVLLFTGPAAPSRFYPPLGVPPLGPLNGLAWRLLALVAGPTLLRSANALRDKHGIPRLPHLFRGALEEPALMLTAVSPALFPRPSDWHANHRVCGYLALPSADRDDSLPAQVAAFLAAGEPPVFMTFGSMLAVAAKETREGAKLMLDAAELAGCRAIVQAPWDEIDVRSTSDRILHVSRVRHELVFPHCAAVVHHGGAGTTHSASGAGRPSVLVPYVADQTFWADVLRRHGVAPSARTRRHATPASLAQAMRQALSDVHMQEHANVLGAAIRGEHPVSTAVEAISGLSGSAP